MFLLYDDDMLSEPGLGFVVEELEVNFNKKCKSSVFASQGHGTATVGLECCFYFPMDIILTEQWPDILNISKPFLF